MKKQLSVKREVVKTKNHIPITPIPTQPGESVGNESQTMPNESSGGVRSEVYYEAPRGEGGQPVEVEGFDRDVIRESQEPQGRPSVQPKPRTKQAKQPKRGQQP